MVIKVERGTTTFAIVDKNQLLLHRALENGGAAVSGESLVDDVNTSLVYFEDRYSVGVDRVLVTGVESAQALQEALSASANIRVEELVSSDQSGRRGRQRIAVAAGRSGGSAGFLMRLNINLASQPYEAARFYRRRMGCAGGRARHCHRCCCRLHRLSAGAIARHQSAVGRGTAGDQRASIPKRHRRGACLNKPANRDIADQSEFLNELFARKALSWTRVFTEMERIVPPNLHVVSMKPEYTKTNDLMLHVVVATDSRDRAVELVRHMEKSNHFRQSQVVAEAVTANTSDQSAGPGNIQFDIAAIYVPNAADNDTGRGRRSKDKGKSMSRAAPDPEKSKAAAPRQRWRPALQSQSGVRPQASNAGAERAARIHRA